MAPTSGASAAKPQPGHQALSSSSSAFRTKDPESPSKEALNQARLHLATHPDDSLYAIYDRLNPINNHIQSDRSGSRPVYNPLQRFLEETPREQHWSTLVHFAKGAEKNDPGK